MGKIFFRSVPLALLTLSFSCATKPVAPVVNTANFGAGSGAGSDAGTAAASTATPTQSTSHLHDATSKETKVYLENTKQPVATLNPGISTECGVPDSKGFCKTTLFVEFPNGQKKLQHLKAGSDLVFNGKPYGKAIKDLEIDAWDAQGGIIFLLQLKVSDLDETTIAERVLEKKIAESHNKLTLKELLPTLQRFKFKKTDTLDGFRNYSLQENLSGNLVARTRLDFYFKDEQLKYVLAHRPIKLPTVKKYQADPEFAVYALAADHNKKEADRIIYMFKSAN